MNQEADFDVTTFFRELRELNSTLVEQKVNSSDRARVLINACISQNINTGRRIVGVLAKLGFNEVHARTVLAKGIRREPVWPEWGKGLDGVYFAPEQPPVTL